MSLQTIEALLQDADCILAKHEQLAAKGNAFPWDRFSLLVQLAAPSLEVTGAPTPLSWDFVISANQTTKQIICDLSR